MLHDGTPRLNDTADCTKIPSALQTKLDQIPSIELPAYGFQGHQLNEKMFSALRHHQGRLIFTDSGEITVDTGLRTFEIVSKSAIWIPPRVRHQVLVKERTTFKSVLIHSFLKGFLPLTSCCMKSSLLFEDLISTIATLSINSKPTQRNKLLTAALIEEITALQRASSTLEISTQALCLHTL